MSQYHKVFRYIFYVAGVAVFVFPLVIILVIFPAFQKLLIEYTEDEAVRLARHLSSTAIDDNRLKPVLDYRKEIENLTDEFNLEKLKIFSPNGVILYSSDRENIGKINSHEYFHKTVARGGVYSKIVSRHSKSLEGRILEADVVETYVPIMADGEFLGAIEIYYDITDRKDRQAMLIARFSGVIVIISLMLAMVFLKVFHRAGRIIDERNEVEEQLRSHKNRLEELVHERTKRLEYAHTELEKEVVERRQAEEQALKSKEHWERTFDAMGDLVTIQDIDMRIVKVNRATCEVFGVEPEELIGKCCYQVFRGIEKPCRGCPQLLVMRDSKTHSGEIHHKTLDKTFLVSGSPLFDESGKFSGIIHTAKDITEQKQLESQFIQAQKMEAVGRLSGGVAHDFNNLLSGIIGYSEMIKNDVGDDDRLWEPLEIIHESGKKAAALTRQLLAFSRKQVLEMSPVDLNLVVENMGKMLGRLIGEDIKLEIKTVNKHNYIMADAGQVEQVLMNMAVNARDAMPIGGKLVLDVFPAEIVANQVKNNPGLSAGRFAVLQITDTGEGMAPEIREKIFEPFFTTKEQGKGTGLGMSTVYGIIKQHNGNIYVYSEPAKGTSFKIYFPVWEKEHFGQRDKQRLSLPKGVETVLVVDDSEAILKLIADTLEPLGYTVLKSLNGEDALRLSAAYKGRIDLLLTDVVMPSMNGRQLSEAIVRKSPETRVLFMSGYTDDVIAHQGVLEEGCNFINKPLAPSMLTRKLRKILD